jgi:hypothetical protein
MKNCYKSTGFQVDNAEKETLTHEMYSCYNEKLTCVIEKNAISLNNSLNNNVVHDLETKARLVLRYAEMKLKNI